MRCSGIGRWRMADPTTPLACPNCGEDVTDSPNVDLHEGDNRVDCENCDAPVVVRVSYAVSYVVRMDKELANG